MISHVLLQEVDPKKVHVAWRESAFGKDFGTHGDFSPTPELPTHRPIAKFDFMNSFFYFDWRQRMRFKLILPVLIAAIWIILVWVFSSIKSERPTLLTKYGTIESKKGRIVVEMKSSSPGLTISTTPRIIDLGIAKINVTRNSHFGSIAPSNWVNSAGFFTFIDIEGRSWSFNGSDRTFIHTWHPDGYGMAFDHKTWKGEFPNEFLDRLPEEIKNEALGPRVRVP